jgi:hypothetical protein
MPTRGESQMKAFFLAVGGLATVVMLLQVLPVAGQAPDGPGSAGAPAEAASDIKTSWDEPDLQGIWVHDVEIPLQRPTQFADREFLTEEEVEVINERRARRLDHDYRAERGTPNDVAGAYNAVYHLQKLTGRRTSLIVDPPDGRMPAYTPQYMEQQEIWGEFRFALMQASPACKNQEPGCRGEWAPPSPRFEEESPIYPLGGVNRSYNPEDHGLSVRCLGGFLPAGGERSGFSSGGNGFTRRIVQSPGGISMYYDTGQGQSWQRPSIVMKDIPHLPSHIRGWWGDSRGHWEGDTLVIDVTNFTPKTRSFGAGENLHMVERFTRTGPTTLDYVVTLDDPTTWVKPWTVRVEYTRQDDFSNRVYTDNRCHEGNYGLPALLRGARAEDRAYAEGTGPHPAEICTNACGEKIGANEDQTADPYASAITD